MPCILVLALSASLSAKEASHIHENCMPAKTICTDSIPVDSIWTTFAEDGSIQFSAETIKLMTDATYRSNTYPVDYRPDQIPDLLENGRMAFAMWTLVNTYITNPEQSRTIAFMLAERGIPGEHYLNAFYTYAFADPEVFHFSETEGNYLAYPQRLEEKLESCRTLAAYTYKYQEMYSGSK